MGLPLAPQANMLVSWVPDQLAGSGERGPPPVEPRVQRQLLPSLGPSSRTAELASYRPPLLCLMRAQVVLGPVCLGAP